LATAFGGREADRSEQEWDGLERSEGGPPEVARWRLRPEGPKARQRRAGREERCDDREAPGGTQWSRHAPGGSREAAGVK